MHPRAAVRPSTRRRPPLRRPTRAAALGAAAALTLAACGDDPEDAPEPDPEAEEAPDAAEDPDAEAPEPDDDETAAPDDDPADADDTAEEVEPLDGEPSQEHVSLEAEGHGLTVTDVRVSAHDGFDRVTFELDGDEPVGYEIGWTEDGEATEQGSGHPIEVAGDEALHVALHGIALPFDAAEDAEPWEQERVDGPEDGMVRELVEDTIFEGIHTFVVGADERHAVVVARLEDPQRVVIDLHHDPA
jgi:hypothetical protein